MKRKKITTLFTKQEWDAIKRKVKREKSRINFRCPLCGNGVTMFPGCKIKEIFCAYRYAVQVQNGEGYYDASGTYQSYYKNLDEY